MPKAASISPSAISVNLHSIILSLFGGVIAQRAHRISVSQQDESYCMPHQKIYTQSFHQRRAEWRSRLLGNLTRDRGDLDARFTHIITQNSTVFSLAASHVCNLVGGSDI
jgi:hypothetical protein